MKRHFSIILWRAAFIVLAALLSSCGQHAVTAQHRADAAATSAASIATTALDSEARDRADASAAAIAQATAAAEAARKARGDSPNQPEPAENQNNGIASMDTSRR
jgi:hypothetical protein